MVIWALSYGVQSLHDLLRQAVGFLLVGVARGPHEQLGLDRQRGGRGRGDARGVGAPRGHRGAAAQQPAHRPIAQRPVEVEQFGLGEGARIQPRALDGRGRRRRPPHRHGRLRGRRDVYQRAGLWVWGGLSAVTAWHGCPPSVVRRAALETSPAGFASWTGWTGNHPFERFYHDLIDPSVNSEHIDLP
jgi:hypothetical protein